MVVQQGRLQDSDKITKEEIMAAVRFGADTVFRSEESTITDEDIDVILERGKAKTKEMQEKLKKAEKGDLLDFSLDGGISAQTFEGIDYSDKNLRDHLRMLAANSVGKRERRPPPTSYNPIIISKKSMVVNNQRIKLPKALRIPQMEDHHFYNRERLLELGNLEFENYAALREANQVPPREVLERQRSLLPPELAQEKRELLAEGFGNWSRSQYYHFVKACAKFGRDDIASIANDMDMPQEEVGPYSEAFWTYGPTELKSEWERVVGNIDRGEKRLAKQKKLSALLTKFVSTFENPRDDMVFANKGTAHFALEQDRALLCAVEKHGYGNWDSVREEIRTDSRLKFQHSAQGMTVQAIAKRCDYRMRQMEKELEAREKALKSKRPPNVVAAQKTIDAIKEMDLWDLQSREAQLEGEEPAPVGSLSLEARVEMKERLKERAFSISRLREIEVQLQRALVVADETRQSIYDGAQYVNYSNITLKASGPVTAGKDEKNGPSTKDGVELEAAISPKVLAVPRCRQCAMCMDSNTKLCQKRLEVRDRLIAEATNRSKEQSANDAGKKKSKKRKAESSPKKSPTDTKEIVPPPKKKLMMAKPDGQLKPRVTSQGNKRMKIPDELFPTFCRRISANGTGERMKLINQFVEDHPTISVRQVTIRFAEITTRDRPACVPEVKVVKKTGRAFMFYLRPCFYKYLPPSERPEDWEHYAFDDEKLYEEESEMRRAAKASDKSDPNGDSNSKAPVSGDDGDETEEDSEPSGQLAKTGDEDSE
jgi:SLIDE